MLCCIEGYRIVTHHVMLPELSKATKASLFINRNETAISLREKTAGLANCKLISGKVFYSPNSPTVSSGSYNCAHSLTKVIFPKEPAKRFVKVTYEYFQNFCQIGIRLLLKYTFIIRSNFTESVIISNKTISF